MTINTTAPSNSTDPIDPILHELDLQIEVDRKRRIADLFKGVKKACRRFALEQHPGDPQCFGGLRWEIHQLFTRRMSALIDFGTQERHISPLVCEIAGLIDMAGLPLTDELEDMLHAAVEEVENEPCLSA